MSIIHAKHMSPSQSPHTHTHTHTHTHSLSLSLSLFLFLPPSLLLFVGKGFTFRVNGESCCYFGTITLVSADNLASNALGGGGGGGGFKESSSAFQPCRQCFGTCDEIRQQVPYKTCTIQDLYMYMYTLFIAYVYMYMLS